MISLLQKQKILGLMIISILLAALLALSLPSVLMEPGELFSLQRSDELSVSSQTQEDISWFIVIFQGILVFLIILLPVYVVISLLSKEGRKKLLIDVIRIGLIVLAVMWILENELPFTQPSEPMIIQPGFSGSPEFSGDFVTPPSFEAEPRPWMLTLTIIGGSALIAVSIFFVLRPLSKRKSAGRSQFQDFADNAQATLEAIEDSQMDFQDVIIRCYAEMSQMLMVENNILRDQAMTTQEFEQELLARGFPPQPVRQLTQLFEQVRYGHQKTGESEKRAAKESLNEIIDFCRGLV